MRFDMSKLIIFCMILSCSQRLLAQPTTRSDKPELSLPRSIVDNISDLISDTNIVCSDIQTRMPALAREITSANTRNKNIGAVATAIISTVGLVVTASLVGTQKADSGGNVNNQTATIISSSITGAGSIASAITTAIIGNSSSDRLRDIDEARTKIKNLLDTFNAECLSTTQDSCRVKAKILQEQCISMANSVGLRHAFGSRR